MSPYLQQMVHRFEVLRDAEILGWSGVEMALTEGHEGGEIWDDVSVPYLQMLHVDAMLADGSRLRISTDQADDIWGLSIHPVEDAGGCGSDWSGIYREGVLEFLPRGAVGNVELAIGNDLIEGVRLLIGASTLELSPGEIYEEPYGAFRTAMHDESVLAQVDGAHPRQNKPCMATPTSPSVLDALT